MDFVKIAGRLLSYYYCNRGVGHSQSMMKGVVGTECFVLVPSRHIGNMLRIRRDKIVSLNELPEKLAGEQKPIVLDHTALTMVIEGLLLRIDKLEGDLQEARKHARYIIKD
jgi:hypothetical protein